MGRVKIPPTPRNIALDDIMRRAAARVNPTQRSIQYGNPFEVPPPPPHPLVNSTRPTVNGNRISKDSTKERSSSESLKRKSESDHQTAPAAKKVATTKLSLRSNNSKLAPTLNGETDDKATSTDTMTTNQPTRRSGRVSKVLDIVDDASARPDIRRASASSRPVRGHKKTAKAKTGKDVEHQEALAMLQGENLLADGATTGNTGSPATGRSTRASIYKTSRRGSAATVTTPDASVKLYIPPTVTATQSLTPSDTTGAPFDDYLVVTQANNEFKLDSPLGLPASGPPTPAPFPQDYPISAVNYGYPDPMTDGPMYAASNMVAPAPNMPFDRATMEPSMSFEKAAMDRNSASSGDSGYVTSHVPQMPLYMNGMVPMHAYAYPIAAAPPDGQSFQFVISTKGQKVKGRPIPKNPKFEDESPRDMTGGRNVANTYPRKQPFKAQIEFTGYPPSGTIVPADYTLWEVCQNYPNSLREGNLVAFVQREWSANELCACLKDDAREILNGRPGKDKTMVFQKRMERIKKDLVAKGEFEALVNGPMIREDGRPSWVKRGNVRRK